MNHLIESMIKKHEENRQDYPFFSDVLRDLNRLKTYYEALDSRIERFNEEKEANCLYLDFKGYKDGVITKREFKQYLRQHLKGFWIF